jgi:hypothetical protein
MPLQLKFLALSSFPPGAWRIVRWAVPFVLGAIYQFRGVVARRRAGQSWSESLSNGEKLITGNVWLDALLLAFIFAAVIFAIWFIFNRK